MSDPNKKYPDKNSPPPKGWPKDGVGPLAKDGANKSAKDKVALSPKNIPPLCIQKSDEKNSILTHIDSTPIYRNFTSNLPANAQLRSRARNLRKAGNVAEVTFWMQVHKGKFFKIDFDRQRIIGTYFVDSYIKGLSLVIEIDGSSHNNKQDYDDKREEFLRNLGLKIFRISETRIQHDLGNVLEEFKKFIIMNYSGKES